MTSGTKHPIIYKESFQVSLCSPGNPALLSGFHTVITCTMIYCLLITSSTSEYPGSVHNVPSYYSTYNQSSVYRYVGFTKQETSVLRLGLIMTWE